MARARVVLKGAAEAAQKIAPTELVAPERIDYIDRKYGNIATSEVITAYLESISFPLATSLARG